MTPLPPQPQSSPKIRFGRNGPVRQIVVIAVIVVVAVVGYLWWDERPVRQIDAALQQRDYQQVIVLANDFLREHPDHGRTYELKARALVGLRRWGDATELFERVGVMSAEGERAWSLALLHQQRWTEALPLLTHLHQREPANAEVLHELISCNGKLGHLEEALRQAAQLSELPGHEAQGSLMLGTLHNNRLNRKQAIQAWQRVLQFQPEANALQISADEFFLAFGRAHLLEGQAKEAVPFLERSLAIQPTVDGQTTLGDACEQIGDLPRAIELWSQAVVLQPKTIKAREGLARAAFIHKQPDKAIEWLTPLLDQPELSSTTAYLMQRAFAMSGDTTQSETWALKVTDLRSQEQRRDLIETGIQRAPQSLWSQAVLAHRFAREGNVAQAARILSPLLRDAPNEPFMKSLRQHLENGTPLPSLDLIPLKQF